MRYALIAFLVLASAPGASAQERVPSTVLGASIQPFFTPWDDAEGAIVAAINAARKTVRVQAYSFTSRPIATALIEAKQRGVEVLVTADDGEIAQNRPSRIPDLARAGIPVWLETRYQIAHNKTMVIDAETVITGSYNFTFSAQNRNSENVLIIKSNALAARYSENWLRHQRDATPYKLP